MRFPALTRLLVLVGMSLAPFAPAAAFTDASIVDAFYKTVFGSEYGGGGWQSRIVKKYVKPVRFYIDDRSGTGRGAEATRFVLSLPSLIYGLETSVVDNPSRANFRVYIIRRSDYRDIVSTRIYRNRSASFAPGKCLVRLISGRRGISRSDAVIVADEGDFLFHRCMVEEILQGLGPVNDNVSLTESVFNDRSKHATFTLHDRYLLNMLYDPRIEPGMTIRDVHPLLPSVVARVKARVGVN